MIPYCSTTGTKTTLKALWLADWRILVSPFHQPPKPPVGFRYALDNGAWKFRDGGDFDGDAFMRTVDTYADRADWLAVPDIVCGGLRSLDLSVSWLPKLAGAGCPLLLVVQDDMEPHHVEGLPVDGLFVGGSTDWKEASLPTWGAMAKRKGWHLHLGRCNTRRRIRLAALAECDSFDGTSVTCFPSTLGKLDAETRQSVFGFDAMAHD